MNTARGRHRKTKSSRIPSWVAPSAGTAAAGGLSAAATLSGLPLAASLGFIIFVVIAQFELQRRVERDRLDDKDKDVRKQQKQEVVIAQLQEAKRDAEKESVRLLGKQAELASEAERLRQARVEVAGGLGSVMNTIASSGDTTSVINVHDVIVDTLRFFAQSIQHMPGAEVAFLAHNSFWTCKLLGREAQAVSDARVSEFFNVGGKDFVTLNWTLTEGTHRADVRRALFLCEHSPEPNPFEEGEKRDFWFIRDLDDAQRPTNFGLIRRPQVDRDGWKSWARVGIGVGGRPVGVLCVDLRDDRVWSYGDYIVIRSFADAIRLAFTIGSNRA